jgi:hypothetical protein
MGQLWGGEEEVLLCPPHHLWKDRYVKDNGTVSEVPNRSNITKTRRVWMGKMVVERIEWGIQMDKCCLYTLGFEKKISWHFIGWFPFVPYKSPHINISNFYFWNLPYMILWLRILWWVWTYLPVLPWSLHNFKIMKCKSDMAMYACNASTHEVKIGGSRVWGLPGLHGKTLSQKSKKKYERLQIIKKKFCQYLGLNSGLCDC